MVAVEGVLPESATIERNDAVEAFRLALFSIVCFGIVLAPIAIAKGLKARKEILDSRNVRGSGVALAAIIIGINTLILWLINMFDKIDTFG